MHADMCLCVFFNKKCRMQHICVKEIAGIIVVECFVSDLCWTQTVLICTEVYYKKRFTKLDQSSVGSLVSEHWKCHFKFEWKHSKCVSHFHKLVVAELQGKMFPCYREQPGVLTQGHSHFQIREQSAVLQYLSRSLFIRLYGWMWNKLCKTTYILDETSMFIFFLR